MPYTKILWWNRWTHENFIASRYFKAQVAKVAHVRYVICKTFIFRQQKPQNATRYAKCPVHLGCFEASECVEKLRDMWSLPRMRNPSRCLGAVLATPAGRAPGPPSCYRPQGPLWKPSPETSNDPTFDSTRCWCPGSFWGRTKNVNNMNNIEQHLKTRKKHMNHKNTSSLDKSKNRNFNVISSIRNAAVLKTRNISKLMLSRNWLKISEAFNLPVAIRQPQPHCQAFTACSTSRKWHEQLFRCLW